MRPQYKPLGPRILVVEDDAAVLELVVTRLEVAGFQTFSARDGIDALARVAKLRPAGMVLDVNMPRMDGFGVLERLREKNLIASTPTLVLTARNNQDDVRRAIELGARDYLAKPFKDEQLISRVRRLLQQRARPLPANPPTPQAADKGILL